MIELRHFTVLNNKEYLVSTVGLDDFLETGVFESVNKEVINWNNLYHRSYKSIKDAYEGHIEVVNNLDKCLEYADLSIEQRYYEALNEILKVFGIEEENENE